MILFDVKQYYILYRICKNEDDSFVTSDQLADELGLTSRTIKGMITELIPYAEKKGFTINSKKGSGYSAEIFDLDLYSRFRMQLYRFFNKYNANLCEHDLRVLYLILYLLQVSTPVSIEKLKTMFYVSYSTIYNDMLKAKKILKRGLILETLQGNRVQIQGSEIRKRNQMALIYNDLLFSEGILELFHDPYYSSSKITDEEYTIFSQMLVEHHITVSNEAFELLIFNIKLANQRYILYKRINYKAFSESAITQLSEYHCAKSLFKALKYPLSESNEEVALFTAYLLVYNNKHGNNQERYGEYYPELIDFVQTLCHDLNQRFDQIFSKIPEFNLLIFPVFAKLFFAITMNIETLSFDNLNYRSEMTTNQVYGEFARVVAEIISFHYQKKISVSLIQIVSFSFEALFESLPKPTMPLNILVIPKENENYWPFLMNKIQNSLPIHPQVDFIYEYQIDNTDMTNYDLILSDYNSLLVHSNAPVVHINLKTIPDVNLLMEYSRIQEQKNFELIYQFIQDFDYIFFHENYIFEGISDLLINLQEEIMDNLIISSGYIKAKNHTYNYYSANGVVVIPNLYSNKNSKNILSIYQISKEMNSVLWRERRVNKIIFINYDIQGELKSINSVIQFVDYIVNAKQATDYSVLKQIVRESEKSASIQLSSSQ